MRSSASAPIIADTFGSIAASVWNTFGSRRITRDVSAAFRLARSGEFNTIGTSPKIVPGNRCATKRSTPSMTFVISHLPSTTMIRQRAPPSWAMYSPFGT